MTTINNSRDGLVSAAIRVISFKSRGPYLPPAATICCDRVERDGPTGVKLHLEGAFIGHAWLDCMELDKELNALLAEADAATLEGSPKPSEGATNARPCSQ